MKCTLCCFCSNWLTSLAFTGFFTVTLKSIAVTLMVGTRTAIASKRSLNCGNIRVMPAASFVSTDNRLAGRARAPQIGVIRVDHLLIVHRGVDRRDGTRLDAVSIIQQFNDGIMQFVVQDAFETIRCSARSWFWFTPKTTVASRSLLPG